MKKKKINEGLENQEHINFEKLYEPYLPEESPFTDDSERVRLIKEAIFTQLDEVDRRVFLLYMELESLRKLGIALKVSPSTAHIKVKSIKEKIKEYVESNLSSNTSSIDN